MTLQPFHELLLKEAKAAGFPLAGAVDIAGAPIHEHMSRYDRWLGQGFAGDMQYLVRGRDRRSDPTLVFPGAKSVFCVAQPYPAAPAGNTDPSAGPRYARYLRASDYHHSIAERLDRVMESVAEKWQSSGNSKPAWKTCVDTSAVLERSWAALAGLGWIGKNTLLIHPQFGSYLLLGEVLIDTPTGAAPAPLPDYCGNCRRCLDTCPTRALPEPHALDASRCISYWTLEKRGDLAIGAEDRKAVGTWIAGCDLCQEVCPFNTKAAKSEAVTPSQESYGAISVASWRELLEESFDDYRARVADSSLKRVKPGQFSRNLAITLSNAFELSDFSAREKMRGDLLSLIEARVSGEMDESARTEWIRCLERARDR